MIVMLALFKKVIIPSPQYYYYLPMNQQSPEYQPTAIWKNEQIE